MPGEVLNDSTAGQEDLLRGYTRKSTDEGLDKEFNTLDAQRESAEAYVRSQAGEGWVCLAERYDDGGFTGGNMDRPALRRLLADIQAGKVNCVLVYKVDRLSRSLLDFARMMELFDRHRVAFVSVTQQFNTASSMGRLVLNVLLSFAQFEREIISERTRDKIAAARRKGKWAGGHPILGYDIDVHGFKLVANSAEARRVRTIFDLYLKHQALIPVVNELERRGWRNKRWTTRNGTARGGTPFTKATLHYLLRNVAYVGRIKYKHETHPGEHPSIVDESVFDRVQAVLSEGRPEPTAVPRPKSHALLQGLIRCAPCGCAMVPTRTTRNKTRQYRYYVCSSARTARLEDLSVQVDPGRDDRAVCRRSDPGSGPRRRNPRAGAGAGPSHPSRRARSGARRVGAPLVGVDAAATSRNHAPPGRARRLRRRQENGFDHAQTDRLTFPDRRIEPCPRRPPMNTITMERTIHFEHRDHGDARSSNPDRVASAAWPDAFPAWRG